MIRSVIIYCTVQDRSVSVWDHSGVGTKLCKPTFTFGPHPIGFSSDILQFSLQQQVGNLQHCSIQIPNSGFIVWNWGNWRLDSLNICIIRKDPCPFLSNFLTNTLSITKGVWLLFILVFMPPASGELRRWPRRWPRWRWWPQHSDHTRWWSSSDPGWLHLELSTNHRSVVSLHQPIRGQYSDPGVKWHFVTKMLWRTNLWH